MRPKLFGWISAVWILAGIGACAPLEPLEAGTCGNGVVELGAGENCDSFADEGRLCLPPGDEHQCRYACGAKYDDAKCPGGMGCGRDGICRAGAHSFDQVQVFPVGWDPDLRVGDFNGDKQADLVLTSSNKVKTIMFDSSGRIVGGDEYATRVPHTTFGRLNQDETDDLVVSPPDAFLDSVMVLTSQTDGTLQPKAYGSEPIPATDQVTRMFVYDAFPTGMDPVDHAPTHAGDEVVIVTGAVTTYWNGDVANYLPINSKLPLADLLEFAHVGSFDLSHTDKGPSWRSYQQLAFKSGAATPPFIGVTHVQPSENGRAFELVKVRIPPACSSEGDFLVVDVNGDGADDLLLPASGDGTAKLCVAYSQRDGTFHSDETALTPPEKPDNSFGVWRTKKEFGSVLLAAGDFNSDGELDFIFGKAYVPNEWAEDSTVTLSVIKDGNVEYMQAPLPPGTPPWIPGSVRVADFNQDGHLDLLVNEGSDLVYFTGSGKGVFTRKQIETAGSPNQVVLGDLDGDGLLDVAFSEFIDQIDKNNAPMLVSQLTVCFGSRDRGLTPPISFGRFPSVLAMSAGNIAEFGQMDGADDLLVVAEASNDSASDEQGVDRSLAIFNGRGDRHLISPFRLSISLPKDPKNLGYQIEEAIGFSVGHFTPGERKNLDIAALSISEDGTIGVFSLPVRKDAAVEPASVRRSEPILAAQSNLVWASESMQATALALGDQAQEQLLVFGTVTDESSPNTQRAGVIAVGRFEDDGSGNGTGRFMFRPDEVNKVDELYGTLPMDGLIGTTNGNNEAEAPTTVLNPSSYLHRADVDGDGRLDLLALAFRTRDNVTTPQIIVFTNHGDGKLDINGRQVFSFTGTTDEHSRVSAMSVRDFDILPRQPNGPVTVVLAGSQHLLLGALKSGNGGADGSIELLPNALPEVNNPTNVRLADFTGDGVPDIAVATMNNFVEIYRQKAVLP